MEPDLAQGLSLSCDKDAVERAPATLPIHPQHFPGLFLARNCMCSEVNKRWGPPTAWGRGRQVGGGAVGPLRRMYIRGDPALPRVAWDRDGRWRRAGWGC